MTTPLIRIGDRRAFGPDGCAPVTLQQQRILGALVLAGGDAAIDDLRAAAPLHSTDNPSPWLALLTNLARRLYFIGVDLRVDDRRASLHPFDCPQDWQQAAARHGVLNLT